MDYFFINYNIPLESNIIFYNKLIYKIHLWADALVTEHSSPTFLLYLSVRGKRQTKGMTENEREKKRFRATKTWKEFRESIRKKTKIDFLTGKPLHGKWELHHLDLNQENYQVLDEENFIPLNSRSHSTIHFLYSYYLKDPFILDRLRVILDKMKQINNS